MLHALSEAAVDVNYKITKVVCFRMDSLKGVKLIKADGSSVEADSALEGKVMLSVKLRDVDKKVTLKLV